MIKILRVLSTTVIISFILTSCNLANKPYSTEIFVMSTYVTQQIYGQNSKQAGEKINNALVDLENRLSLFVEGSELDRVNQQAGLSAVKVSDYTFELVKTAIQYSEDSQGLFDITIAPLSLLWGIDTPNAHVPNQIEIDETLKLVNYKKVILNDKEKSIMLTQKGMAIDLGGIAKGYVVDVIKTEYDKLEIKSALVSIGGNIFAYGTKPNNQQFTLGIRDPNGITGSETIGKLQVEDKVVATSGAYERFYEQDGKIYHHILDLSTGYPVDSNLSSVTIICEDGGLSDYLSTTLFIAGKDHIHKYLNDERFEAIVIDSKNMVYLSESLKDSFELTNDKYTLA